MKSKPIKTYPANFKGRQVHVTVPDNTDEGNLLTMLKDNFSPQAIAAMSSYLHTAVDTVGTTNLQVNNEITWLADKLVSLLGGVKPYNRICKEIGL